MITINGTKYAGAYEMIEAAYLAGFEPDDETTGDELYEEAAAYLLHESLN